MLGAMNEQMNTVERCTMKAILALKNERSIMVCMHKGTMYIIRGEKRVMI